MIWESVAFTTVLDLVIVTLAGASLFVLYCHRAGLARIGQSALAAVLAVGAVTIGLFYFVELVVVWVVPLWLSRSEAMAIAEALHRNYSWLVMLVVSAAFGGGTYLVRKTFQRAQLLEGQVRRGRRSLGEHLERSAALAYAQRIAQVGNWNWDLRDDTAEWSDEHFRIFGYVPGEFEPTYQRFIGSVHPEDRERLDTASSAARRGDVPSALEYRVVRPDGSIRFIHSQAEVRTDPLGKPIRVFGIVDDITELREASEAVRQSEEQMQLALRGAGLGAWDSNLRTDQVSCNDRFKELLGYGAGELAMDKRVWAELIHPEDAQVVAEAVDAHRQGRTEQFAIEHRVRHKRGHWIWVLNRGRIVGRDASGEPRRAAGTILDITARKRAQERVQELNRNLERRVAQRTAEANAARSELQRVFDLSVDMICVVTLDGRFQRVNPAFGRFLGYAKDDLIGVKYIDFVHADDREATLVAVREKVVAGEDILNFENRYRHKDGSYRWLMWNSRTVLGDGVAYGTARDVTEQKLAAEELLRHRDHLTELVAESTAELRIASAQQAAAASLGEKALGGMPADEIVQEAVTVVARELGVEFSSLMELLPGGEELLLRAGVGHADGLVGTLRVDVHRHSQAGYTLTSNDPVFVEDLRTETRFEPSMLSLERGLVCGISVIIRGPQRPLGVLGVFSDEPLALKREDGDFVQSIANVVGDAVAFRRASDEAREAADALRALAARLQDVREEERTFLARELHDELGQSLTGVNIDLAWMARKLAGREPQLQERALASMKLIGETIGAVQRISSDLRPPVLDDLGLLDATRWYVEAFARRNGLAASIELPAEVPDLATGLATAVFRVVQEALTNVARHADASEIRVVIESSDDSLEVRVIDDGHGIAEEETTGDLSLGLLGMKERAASFDGVVAVASGREAGTEVVLKVPLAANTGRPRVWQT